MKFQDIVEFGVPASCVGEAFDFLKSTGLIHQPAQARETLAAVAGDAGAFVDDPVRGPLARAIAEAQAREASDAAQFAANPIGTPSTFAHWGERDDPASFDQMRAACDLPIAVQGALMPDNHLGYGLPIGGVLATYNSVIPYGVGVDIACRMMCTITDLPARRLHDPFNPKVDSLIRAIERGTVFGVGGRQKDKPDHSVMDADWSVAPIARQMKDRAWEQLGTSGSGNHFVEFGIVTLETPELGLEPGEYVALLSHSGSRGAGAAVCKTYSDIAMSRLPKTYERFKHLAWLSLESQAGQEYWNAMNLMGEYASANHHVIHDRVLSLAGAQSLAVIENHHNFAWKEIHNGQELVVHRKGATPAGQGVLGVIPGSMADPAFLVRGKGKPESLHSAAHGAGRRMSRSQARKSMHWPKWKAELRHRGVRVLSCGIDEVPGVYKNILTVMSQQADLIDVVGRFDPKLVKMSDDGTNED